MTAGVYRIYDPEGVLLYIGSAKNVEQRMHGHRSLSIWRHRIDRWSVDQYNDRAKAYTAEAAAIQAEFPRWNVKDRSPEHPAGLLSWAQIAVRYPDGVARPPSGTATARRYDELILPALLGWVLTSREMRRYSYAWQWAEQDRLLLRWAKPRTVGDRQRLATLERPSVAVRVAA